MNREALDFSPGSRHHILVFNLKLERCGAGMRERFVVIDGSSLIHRAFYALPLLTNREGVFTNAVYGFTTMLFRVIEEQKPDYLTVCFDKSRVTFRTRQYEEYKSHRKKAPPELTPQFEFAKKIVEAMGIKYFEVEDYEADDVIGTLVKNFEQHDIESIVITGDKDVLQLVSPLTKVILTQKGISQIKEYNESEVWERYGLSPSVLKDLIGLMGDPSDNIPGAPGVGEKTAIKLLEEYSNLDELYQNIDRIKGKIKEKLKENKNQIFLSRELATIEIEVPIGVELEELKWKGLKYEELLNIFSELEFNSLIKKLFNSDRELFVQQQTEEEKENGFRDFQVISSSPEDLEEFFTACLSKDADVLAFHVDSENFGLSCQGQLTAFSMDNFENVRSILQKHLAKFTLICFDLKTVYKILKNRNFIFPNLPFDTMIAAYLLNPSASSYSLPELCLEYLNITSLEGSDDLTQAAVYAQALEKLFPVLEDDINAADMNKLYREVELPLACILAEMELLGVKIDRKALDKMGKELEKKISELQSEICFMAGENFNINSPKQLGKILFEKLDLPVIKKTKSGYSTNAEVLEALTKEHPIAEKLLLYRQYTKLKSTYVEGLKKLLTDKDKIHTTFNQTITSTGRLSSTEPNLQNIPIRLELGRKLRKAFIPSQEKYCILAADYSQIELRILAHISEDENLIDAFCKDQDIHLRTASEVFHVDMSEVTEEMRYSAKAVNFGIIYGISDYGLSQDLKISRAEAKKYIDKYLERYPGVASYMENIVLKAREQGYVTTFLNRRRYLSDLFSPNKVIRNFGERTALNTPIQGSAADIIKLAMVAVDKKLKSKELSAKMILQVHDELIFEVEKDNLQESAAEIVTIMEDVYSLKVPLKVDVKWGKNWYDLQDL